MANIKHLLDKIRTAIYGKEVRGSLADGLQAVNNESEDAKEISVNVEQRQDAVEEQFDDVLKELSDDREVDNAETIAARTNRVTGENHKTLGNRLDDENKQVTEQLADTEHQRFFESMINKKVKPKKPFITLVDDDGNRGFYTKLFPLAKEYNIPITSAMITNRAMGFPGDDRNYYDRYYHFDEIMEMQESGLVEFVSHTHNHPWLDELSDEEIYEELFKSREFMKKWGFNHRLVVYPGGRINERVINVAKQVYDYSTTFGGDNIVVNPPFSNYKIGRVPINQSMKGIKEKIDEAKKLGTWVIIRGHIDQDYPNYQEDWYREIIEYALSEGFEFVTHEEGLRHFANIAELSEDETIDYQGNIHGFKWGRTHIDKSREVDGSTPLSHFRPHTITHSTIGVSNSDGMPGESGMLSTYFLSENEEQWNYQEFVPLNLNNKYIRYWVVGERYNKEHGGNDDYPYWSEWYLLNGVDILPDNSVDDKTKARDFPIKKTLVRINSDEGGRENMPEGRGGILETDCFSHTEYGWGFQKYTIAKSNNTYVRHEKANGDWSDWTPEQEVHRYVGTNKVSSDKPPKDYKLGITLNQITVGGDFDMAGVLTTYVLSHTETQYSYQEFKETRTHDKYIRYGTPGNSWSDWKKYALEDI